MRKTLVMALLASSVMAVPAVNATTVAEETGFVAEGRTGGSMGTKLNTAAPAPAPAKVVTPTPVIAKAPAPAPAPAPKMARVAPSAGNNMDMMGRPMNARPGECYGKVTIPAVKETVTERILVQPAGKDIARIVPATYKNMTETVTVKDASEELVVIPATYKTVTETITVKPASKNVVKVPAQYETRTERVLVKAARSVWKPGVGPNQRYDAATGDIMCLVEEPAEYKTITKRVMVKPASTREEMIPAVTKTITKRVVDQPSRVERRAIPAVTDQVTTTVLAQPERIEYKEIPAQYSTITKQVEISPAKVAWSEILCNTNANSQTVMAVQKALKAAGYNPGNVDGVLGRDTYNAVSRFQAAKGLHRGQITMETLKALGVSA